MGKEKPGIKILIVAEEYPGFMRNLANALKEACPDKRACPGKEDCPSEENCPGEQNCPGIKIPVINVIRARTREEALRIIASTDDLFLVITNLSVPEPAAAENAVAATAQKKGIRVIGFCFGGDIRKTRERFSDILVLDKTAFEISDITNVINERLQALSAAALAA